MSDLIRKTEDDVARGIESKSNDQDAELMLQKKLEEELLQQIMREQEDFRQQLLKQFAVVHEPSSTTTSSKKEDDDLPPTREPPEKQASFSQITPVDATQQLSQENKNSSENRANDTPTTQDKRSPNLVRSKK